MLSGVRVVTAILALVSLTAAVAQAAEPTPVTLSGRVVDAMAAKWTKRIPKTGNFALLPGKFAISDDGRLAALLTHDIGPDERPTASIELYALETTERLAKTIPVTEIGKAVPYDGAMWFGVDPNTLLAVAPARMEHLDDGYCSTFWFGDFARLSSALI